MAPIGSLTHTNQSVRWHIPCGKDPGEMSKRVDVRQGVLADLPLIYHDRSGPFPLNRLTEKGAAQGNV